MMNPFEAIENRLDKIEKAIAVIGRSIANKPEKESAAPNGQLVKIEDAIRITGYKRGYIYELIHRNAIPFIKRGHSIRFDPAELELWMRAGRPNIFRETIDRLK